MHLRQARRPLIAVTSRPQKTQAAAFTLSFFWNQLLLSLLGDMRATPSLVRGLLLLHLLVLGPALLLGLALTSWAAPYSPVATRAAAAALRAQRQPAASASAASASASAASTASASASTPPR